MAILLDIGALGIHQPIDTWWEWAFIGLTIASAVAGSCSLLLLLFRAVRAWSTRDKLSTSIPPRIQAYLDSHTDATALKIKNEPVDAASFGVYLGKLSTPPTDVEAAILSKWDIVILDPLQPGVREAIAATHPALLKTMIGRLDLPRIHKPKQLPREQDMIAGIEDVRRVMDAAFGISNGSQRAAFTGVLLAGWEEWLPLPVFNGLCKYMMSMGLEIYLEVAPPNFLEKIPDMNNFAGVVIRNGTILRHGNSRDFFQMAPMKSTVKAFVTQACLRDFRTMMWETVDDPSTVTHAVLKRCWNWCKYYSVMVYVNSEASLTIPERGVGIEEPLAAFQWLKENRIMKIHGIWRNTHKLISHPARQPTFDKIEQIVPTFQYLRRSIDSASDGRQSVASTPVSAGPVRDSDMSEWSIGPSDLDKGKDWFQQLTSIGGNPLSFSPKGESYNLLGCFPVGLHATAFDRDQILQTQRHLITLGKLDPVLPARLRDMGAFFRKLYESVSQDRFTRLDTAAIQAIDYLAKDLWAASDNPKITDPIEVYIGLDSGFRRPGDVQFWAVFDLDIVTGGKKIFVARKAVDLEGTILHTFLASRGIARHTCFAAELEAATFKAGAAPLLPKRVEVDINLLTPGDIILFFQHLKLSEIEPTDTMLRKIKAACEVKILEGPSFAQLKKFDAAGYLSGKTSDKVIIDSRTTWYEKHGYQHFDRGTALRIFREVRANFVDILMSKRHDELAKITEALDSMITDDGFDAYSDIVALAVFCAARKSSFDEIYLEVSDRNPLFNQYSDQAGAMSEMFALGARCEDYFDLTPSAFGKVMSDRHREHYNLPANQPPIQLENADGFSSSYAVAQIDIDVDSKKKVMPTWQRLTFLSVFAIPAFIDIMLLTTTGHGLYLSAFMSKDEQTYATLALMISLPLSSAIGTWIAIGGSYYLNSMAFPAANMYVLTRLIGGMVVTLVGAILGLLIISGLSNFKNGLVFFLYFLVLTGYLSILAVLASYQYLGSSFQNGRTIILLAIPILAISPIITIWVPRHDTVIYLITLYIFIGWLVIGARQIGAQWVTWYSKVKAVGDKDVREWYVNIKGKGDPEVFSGMKDPAALVLARDALLVEVNKERAKHFWEKPTTDKFVLALANGWDATVFLLGWYCTIQGSKQPIPYSSTWNVQVKVGLDTLLQAQKGIRVHNAFVLWRQAGDEVICGVLYFLLALLDRWVELLTGGDLLGLSAALNNSVRKAVGLGLAYYLIGAVILDYKSYHLNEVVHSQMPIPIGTAKDIRKAVLKDAKTRQQLYLGTLLKFLSVHSWALAVTATLLWILDGTSDGMIMYLSYVGAYTGLLLYQYNKIFSGSNVLMPLLSAITVGLPMGLALRICLPQMRYNTVIALACATWTAALLSLKTAKIAFPKELFMKEQGGKGAFHSYDGLGNDQDYTQTELEKMFDSVLAAPSVPFPILPSNFPGVEVKAISNSCNREFLTEMAEAAFPDVQRLTNTIMRQWEGGKVRLELASIKGITGKDMKALSRFHDGVLHILVNFVDRSTGKQPQFLGSDCQYLAEILLHAGAEFLLDMQHESALLAEALPALRVNSQAEEFKIQEGLKRAVVGMKSEERTHAVITSKKQLLRALCFGLDCDILWETLPGNIRTMLLRRSLGERYNMTKSDMQWLKRKLAIEETIDTTTFIARCDLAAYLIVNRINYLDSLDIDPFAEKFSHSIMAPSSYDPREAEARSSVSKMAAPFVEAFHGFGTCLKFFVVSLTADPEFHRELRFVLSKKPAIVANVSTILLSAVWITCKKAQNIVLPWFLLHNRQKAKRVWDSAKGTRFTLKSNRLIVENLDETYTSFFTVRPTGDFKLSRYAGLHKTEPEQAKKLKSICWFTSKTFLSIRQEYSATGELVNEYTYEYADKSRRKLENPGKTRNPRIPISRTCIRGKNEFETVHFNRKGFIESGSYVHEAGLARFKYHYRKSAKFEDELLRAEFVLPDVTCNVNWCAPPVRHAGKMERWIPNSRVTEATFVRGADVYECTWFYDHQHHPTITAVLNGTQVETPDMILYDWLGVLKKPTNCSFSLDNPLLEFRSMKSNIVSRTLGLNVKRSPISTSRARSQLWRAWKNGTDHDGVLTRWLDENLMRHEPLLKPYYRRRDRGALAKAEEYISQHADSIMAASELSNDISSWTPLAIKLGDLSGFGQGGDALMFTRNQKLQSDTQDSLHIMAVDTGTWPNEGGGVSACRRDMVNNLKSIKWHMLVESANDYGLPKHQIEENVQSLKIVPLWGLDFLHPVHGVFHNKLDAEVDRIPRNVDFDDIQRDFIPALTTLVNAARALEYNVATVHQATRALVDLNTYFEHSRHWASIWTSDIVKNAWRHLWLEDGKNVQGPGEWFETELPTLMHLDLAMDLWFRYLFIMSIPVPEKIPSVFQASHHSVCASYGVICKIKRGCTLQIWDHAISWRETNLYLSSALCVLPPFVRNSLLGLMRITSIMALHHADQILPCADFFNIGWEIEVGSVYGTLDHRKRFARKVDPVVNGIPDMKKFSPVETIGTKKPTVTMLSHVWFAKDIKTAILAANVIVNEWGFTDYQLHIYGALDKSPVYSAECQEILASKSLRDNVHMKGTADPKKVLADSWLFLNSSVSEGLPLALGEAALTGVPVVCTDVGASLRVLTDQDDGSRYSEVVAPNDATSLARAQINILAMIGEWSAYADDNPFEPAPVLPFKPTAKDVEIITARMYKKDSQRRKLGLMARDIVQKAFSGERYLREHEQMLWIGKSWAKDDTDISLLGHASQTNLLSPAAATRLVAPSYRYGRTRASSVSSFDDIASLRESVWGNAPVAHDDDNKIKVPRNIRVRSVSPGPRTSIDTAQGLGISGSRKFYGQAGYSRSNLSLVSAADNLV